MTAFFRKSRFLIRLLCFTLTASIVGCQSGDLVAAGMADDIPPSVESKISVIVQSIQSNPVGQEQIAAMLSERHFASRGLSDDDIPVLTAEEIEQLDVFYEDPGASLNEIYLEENQGAEKIDLLFAIYTQQDYNDVRGTLSEFLTADELASVDAQIAEVEASMSALNVTTSQNIASRGLSGPINERALHFMAGAAVTLVVAAFVYAVIPWFHPVGKIAAAAAVGVVSGVFAGYAKELRDGLDPERRTQDFRGDFLRTAAGSAATGVFVVATATAARAVGVKRTTAAIFWLVSGAILGLPVVRNLIQTR